MCCLYFVSLPLFAHCRTSQLSNNLKVKLVRKNENENYLWNKHLEKFYDSLLLFLFQLRTFFLLEANE
jgi:hypothetical protein